MSEIELKNPNVHTTLFSFLRETIEYRLKTEFTDDNPELAELPELYSFNSGLSDFITHHKLNRDEVIVLLLALTPHLLPNFLNNIISDFFPNGGELPEFGGVKGKNHRGILPTGETVQYILAGNEIEKRIQVTSLFNENHLFARLNVLSLESLSLAEPKMSGRLIIEEEYLELFTTGSVFKPKLSSEFPAQRIETNMKWEDLILNHKTFNQIKEIEVWLKYNHILMDQWKMRNKIKPGYRIMFYGPPGTGKTLTASLLGKYTQKDVYRIDLSMVVSKYIGETEKNLSKLFDKASNKDWILFFDEADAVFGKRTNVRDAHDKYANQEVSYLLQRIESHSGLVILASNFKNNIDTAFTRRFQSIVEFENPTYNERLQLWKNNLPQGVNLHEELNLINIAKKYEITGANIVNIIQHACLKCLAENDNNSSYTLTYKHIMEGIKKEYLKEDRMM